MLDPVRIVLMETTHPGNVGAVARAMKNMGLTQLYLVNPAHWPSEVAEKRAAGGLDVLSSAHVVSSLEQAIGDCVLVIGASARSRSLPWPVMNPRDSVAMAAKFIDQGPVAFVFGREDRGLTNEELQRCHYHVHIPANPEYSALNLAMAVQVVAYELRMAHIQGLESETLHPHMAPMRSPQDPGWDVAPATAAEVDGMLEHLEAVLVQIGFHSPEHPRQLMTRLRRLYQRTHLDKMEVNMLRGMYKAIQKAVPLVGGGAPTDE